MSESEPLQRRRSKLLRRSTIYSESLGIICNILSSDLVSLQNIEINLLSLQLVALLIYFIKNMNKFGLQIWF